MSFIEEYHVNDKNVRQFHQDKAGYLTQTYKKSSFSPSLLWPRIRSVFFPEGYPDSVSADYIYYQGWDTVQAFASSISGSLATSAVLKGVGVGDETATPLAASITWLLRDGCGMVGRILFAARIGTQLDYDCKKWRLFADVLNDMAMLIEILTPKFGKEFTLPVLCCASISRSLVGVAGGATKAAVAQHQAKSGNMADLNAKDGSQETMINLIALIINLIILPWLSNYPGFVFPLFLLMTCLHIFANFKAVRSLEFSTLNLGRLNVLLEAFDQTGSILSIPQANRKESLGFSLRRQKIKLGVSLDNVAGNIMDLQSILENDPLTINFEYNGTHYILINKKAITKDILSVYIGVWSTIFAKHKLKDVRAEELISGFLAEGWNIEQKALQTEGYTFTYKKHLHEE